MSVANRFEKTLWGVELGLKAEHFDGIEWRMSPGRGPDLNEVVTLHRTKAAAERVARSMRDLGKNSVRVVRWARGVTE